MVTRTVDVDGVAMRVRTANLAQRRAGQPVVVFESGGGMPLETWDPILDELARATPFVAYDRAGNGQSGWDGLPPTPERVCARLIRLLAVLDAAPPYVLVGHSWGGALVRHFAGAHPEGVAGILYIDPTDVTLTRAELIVLFESFGAGAAQYEAFEQTMADAMARVPPPLRAESDIIMSLLDGNSGRLFDGAPGVRASVIVAGRIDVPPQDLLPFDGSAFARAMYESQVRRLRAWALHGGTFHVAAAAGHMVHAEEPALVLSEIRRLLAVDERE